MSLTVLTYQPTDIVMVLTIRYRHRPNARGMIRHTRFRNSTPMFTQVSDFKDECTAFADLVDRALVACGSVLFSQPTQFKHWTLNDILGHLHVWNWAADASLQDPERFDEFFALVAAAAQRGQMRQFERQWLKDLEGQTLLTEWRDFIPAMCERFAQADPNARVKWAGPDMSVRSSITARLMETWAHAQAVYDVLGVVRQDQDRIKNVAVLGVNTYGWTFKNRGLAPPQPAPFVALQSPSGANWEFNSPNKQDYIRGNATEFCQVVTQVRNVHDTSLVVHGANATRWMEIAQCFAGAPETPPAPGARCIASTSLL